MIATTVDVRVKPENVEEFIEACRKNHENSVKEDGNLSFDVLRSRDDPCRFMLYEAYDTEDAAKAHKNTAHYLEWREAVADWMAEPRKGAPFKVLFPAEKDQWRN